MADGSGKNSSGGCQRMDLGSAVWSVVSALSVAMPQSLHTNLDSINTLT